MNFDRNEFFLLIDHYANNKGLPKERVTNIVEEGIAIAVEREIINNSKYIEFAKTLNNFIEIKIDINKKEISICKDFYIIKDDAECLYPEFQVSEQKLKSIELLIEQHNRTADKNSNIRVPYKIDRKNNILTKKIDCQFSKQQYNATRQYVKEIINREFSIIKIEDILEKERILSGKICDVKKDFYMISMGDITIKLPKVNLMINDDFKLNDKIVFTIEKSDESKKGTLMYDNKNHHAYLAVRKSTDFLRYLLLSYIPEIKEENIKYLLRGNGKNKIILIYQDDRLKNHDFVSNLKNKIKKLTKEHLNNEIFEIIEYRPQPIHLLIELLSPTQILKINKEDDIINLIFYQKDLQEVILRDTRDQTALEDLIGHKIAFYSTDEWRRKEVQERSLSKEIFKKYLDIKEYIIKFMQANDLITLNDIGDIPEAAFINMSKQLISREKAIKIRNAAIETLETSELFVNSIYELSKIGFKWESIMSLQDQNILTTNDIADLDIFELMEKVPTINNQQASKIIMEARKRGKII